MESNRLASVCELPTYFQEKFSGFPKNPYESPELWEPVNPKGSASRFLSSTRRRL